MKEVMHLKYAIIAIVLVSSTRSPGSQTLASKVNADTEVMLT